MELNGRKCLVVGAGKSGVAAARFLVRKGARVVLTDERGPECFNFDAESVPAEVDLALGRYPEVTGERFDLVVMSPGVPLTVAPVVEARRAGIPVIGELELACRFLRSPMVAITGTNGKTTTTTLVGEIFRAAGRKTLVAGNIGIPLIEQVENYGPEDVVVVEVSSFQLETAEEFRPSVAVILNITPDHLDRHGTFERYIDAKARIFSQQRPGDYTVLNYDDQNTRKLSRLSPGKVIFFSRRHILETGVFTREGEIIVRLGDVSFPLMRASEVKIPGAHNLENALAAVAAAAVMGVDKETMARTLRTFSGVPHRLEFVAIKNGVRFVNDSKGTNPDASIKALEAYQEPIVLIAGGKNKGSDFTAFAAKVREKVRVLVVVGESAAEIAAAARRAGCDQILGAGSFEEAVLLAYRAARPGEIVLLSPACASWDMFDNYEERGDLFKELVHRLEG